MLSGRLRNLGIDCRKSGLLVADEDRPGALAAYAESIGEVVPRTFAVLTAKGAHYYLRQPEGEPLGNGTGRLTGIGVDIRGAGGFVVAPGSVHQTGVVYRPADPEVPVAPAPDWLLTALRAPRAVPPGRGTGAVSTYGRLRGLVATVLAAAPGQRNNTLFWSACRVADLIAAGQVDQAAAVEVLTRAATAVGLGSSEADATIASALREVRS